MNQNELYLMLMGIPAFILQMTFIIGIAVAVLADSDKLLKRIAKALAVMTIIVVLWEIAMISYVALIKLIN